MRAGGVRGSSRAIRRLTLMRLKELETLEKIADKAKLSVVLGEKGLAEKVVKMI